MSTAHAPTDRRSGPPLWLVEGLDIVESRRRIVLGVAGLIIVVGLLLALLAPGVLPPTPLVGAAVALAALLVGLAAAVVADSSDLRVRGPRHVVAAGGELVAVLPTAGDPEAADELAAVVLEARQPDRSMLLGLAASSLDIAATLRWTDALGLALARRGVSVLRVDLASGRSDAPGLAEVASGESRLTEVVAYEPGMMLARLGAGGDHRDALAALADLPPKLPRDLEVLLAALPIAASRGVVQAARGLDHVLVVAERGDTSRVDLIAGLDALRAADLQAQVILLDDLMVGRIAGRSTAEVAPARARPDVDPENAADAQPATPPEQPETDEAVVEQVAGDGEQPVATPSEPVIAAGSTVAAEPQPSSEPDPTLALDVEPEPASTPAAEVEPDPTLALDVEPGPASTPAAEVEPDPTLALDVEPEPDPTPDHELAPEPTLPSAPVVDTEVDVADQDAADQDAADQDVAATADEEPDADGPPPPPVAALAGTVARGSGNGPVPTDEVIAGPTHADGTPAATEPAPIAEPAEPAEPADPDDAAARAAAIVRAVMAEHRGSAAPAPDHDGGEPDGPDA
jgi:hypothetical protein